MAKRHWLWNFLFPKTTIADMKARGDVAGLVKALDHHDTEIRQVAQEALRALGKHAIEPLIGLLKKGEIPFPPRRIVISILAQSRDARAIETLCWMLTDEDEYVRIFVARALENDPDAHAVAPLIQVAQDAKASVHVQTVLRATLDQAANMVPTEVLRQAAQMNDSYVLIFAQVETSCTFRTYNVTHEEADFTQIKQMARQELIRRGLEA
jgi:HEAT repeat protein